MTPPITPDDLNTLLMNERATGELLPLDPGMITAANSELAAIRHRLNNVGMFSEEREILEQTRDSLQTILDELRIERDGKIARIAMYTSGSITSLFPRELELFDRIREAWRISGKKGWGASA